MSSDYIGTFISQLKETWDEEEGSGARPRIVVVDDDPSMRDAIGFLLQDDYDVTLCETADAGVAAVTDDTAAAILDIKMRGNDGFWACKHIREKQALLPVIFYSAYQDVKNPYEIINDYQPFGYVIKGDDLGDLVAMISRAVDYHRLVRRNKKIIDRLDLAQRELKKRGDETA